MGLIKSHFQQNVCIIFHRINRDQKRANNCWLSIRCLNGRQCTDDRYADSLGDNHRGFTDQCHSIMPGKSYQQFHLTVRPSDRLSRRQIREHKLSTQGNYGDPTNIEPRLSNASWQAGKITIAKYDNTNNLAVCVPFAAAVTESCSRRCSSIVWAVPITAVLEFAL